MQIEAMLPRLDVAEIARSLRFYRALGFEAVGTLESSGKTVQATLRNGAARLSLRLRDRTGKPTATVQDGGVALLLLVASVHDARAAAAAGGLQPPPVARQPDGLEAFHLRDPDGHRIVLAAEPLRIA